MKKTKRIKNKINTEWNLKLLYSGYNDAKIEKDIENTEKMINDFASKYDISDKNYLKDENALYEILSDYERLSEVTENNAITYFSLSQDLNANDRIASSKLALLSNRMAKLGNKLTFFEISIGKIEKDLQDKFLKSDKLKHFRVFLKRIFDDAKYSLSIPEEKIMSLKSQPAYEMWVSGNEKILNMKTIKFKGEIMPISKAMSTMRYISKSADREKLSTEINKVLKEVASFSEAEINAVITNATLTNNSITQIAVEK
jgi:oligoendopeptidase F